MNQVRKNILITGLPGAGKTTAIVRLAEILQDVHLAGFYTSEIREAGVRQGFELVSFDGRRALLSHVTVKGPYHVGRYGVDVKGFENFLEALNVKGHETGLVIVDEIGKMECYSEKFRKLAKVLLDSGKPVIATIAQRGGGFISEVRSRDDVSLFDLTESKREKLPEELARYARTLLATP